MSSRNRSRLCVLALGLLLFACSERAPAVGDAQRKAVSDRTPFAAERGIGMHAIERVLQADQVPADVRAFESGLPGHRPAPSGSLWNALRGESDDKSPHALRAELFAAAEALQLP